MFGLLFLNFVLNIKKNLLIYFTAMISDSFLLKIIAGLVIKWKLLDYFSFTRAHNGSTITNIGNKTLISMEKCNNRARTWAIQFARIWLLVEHLLAFLKPWKQSLLHVGWEAWLIQEDTSFIWTQRHANCPWENPHSWCHHAHQRLQNMQLFSTQCMFPAWGCSEW